MDGKEINHKEEFQKRIAELQASRKEKEEKAKKKVGYCRPPEEYQFKPGTSGNPYGRPRHPRTIEDSLKRELSEKVKLELEGKNKKAYIKLTLIIKQLVNQAANGDLKAIDKILKHCKGIDLTDELEPKIFLPPEEGIFISKEHAKIVKKAIYEELDSRRGINRKPPEFYDETN